MDCIPPQESPVARAGGRHGQGRDGSHLQGRRARRKTWTSPGLRPRSWTRSSAACSRGWTRWKPVGASAATTHPWSLARRMTAGDPDQVQADPTPPAEPPGVVPAPVPPLSPPPLTTARAAATSACRPAVAVRIGVMSGSARTTTTAVLHRGRLYAPDARHQPRCQSQ